MLTSRQQPLFISGSAAASIRAAPAKHLASGRRTPMHQNSTECLVLVHRNVTRHPNQCEPVTLCAYFLRKNCSYAQKTRQPAPVNYLSTQAAQGGCRPKTPKYILFWLRLLFEHACCITYLQNRQGRSWGAAT